MFYEVVSGAVGALLIVLAVLAIHAERVRYSVTYLSALSMLAVVSFMLLKAPDVAVTEAVIGSGLLTALYVFALLSIRKEKNQ